VRIVAPNPAELSALFGPDTRSVWLCSPWITTDGIALLRSAMERCRPKLLSQFELWIRMSEPDRAITDYPGTDQFLKSLRTSAPNIETAVWSGARLHAKVIWTEQGALIGSANLTGAGFGTNVELCVRLEPSESVGIASIRDVLRQGVSRVPPNEWEVFVTETATTERENIAEMDILEKLLSRRPDFGGIR
jgi:phosphatidylserine/phosphatidylglycerophosphate/cardiolipin synthase-like enzyme